MTSYEIDIRAIEPEFKHTLARQAGREVDDGRELHLRRFSVEIVVKSKQDGQRHTQTFSVRFYVDHEDSEVRTARVGDAHNKLQSFRVATLVRALHHAEQAALAYIEDVGPDNYEFISILEQYEACGVPNKTVQIHQVL